MENHAQSIDDALIGGLSYKLKSGASYVTNRRSVSYFASGGNQFSSSGVKCCKFNITGDQWLDPSTFRVAFQLNNHNAAPLKLQPLSWNPAVFFRRARLICGGSVIEDIDDFNRLSLMLTDLMPEDEQHDVACEGFGNFDFLADDEAADQRKGYRMDDYDLSGNVHVSRRVQFKPMLGLFNQEKLIPLRYCPIQIELELVNQTTDAVSIQAANGFTNGSNWDITDIQCKCDLLELDSSLQNEYASHLLSGKSLPINFSTWNHTNQSTGNDKNFSAHITRAVTRLKSIFMTLHKPDNVTYKQCNDFYHPCTNSGVLTLANEHSYQVQIGNKLVPEYPVTSLSESYSQLKKTVGRSFKMHSSWYRSRKYIIGLDLEKISGAGFTGMSTKAGDMLTVNFRDCDASGVADSVPSRMFCALNYDCILNISDGGVILLD